ncbi:unnamed protein product, partial [Adineta ricciae]
HSTLQYLQLSNCNYFQYHLILRTLPNLKTFVIDCFQLENANETINSVQKYERLTSLTISKCNLLMEHFRLVLTTVPSLTYLKLMSTRSVYGPVFNGSFWEEFIQIGFPQLKTFEFRFTYPIRDNGIVHSVNSIIASFRTSFWLQDKRWFTICDHFIKSKQIAVYTKSICVNQDGPLIRCEAVPVSSVCRLIENSNDIETTTLMTLNFSECHIDKQVIQDLADALSDDITIKTLDLHDSRLKNDMLQNLIDLLSKCTQLTTLHLGNNQLGPLGVQHLATLLQSNLTIETLHVPFNSIRNDGIRYIIETLEDNKTLTTLNLQFTEIEDSGMQYIASMFMCSTTLQSLNLSNNYFGVTATQYLSDALKQNNTLITLDLSGNNLGIKGAEFLADALPYTTTLITLNISKTQVLDQGSQAIAIALLSNTSLKSLDLRGNSIEEPGAQKFISLLRQNRRLLSLNLRENRIDTLLLYNTEMMHSE